MKSELLYFVGHFQAYPSSMRENTLRRRDAGDFKYVNGGMRKRKLKNVLPL